MPLQPGQLRHQVRVQVGSAPVPTPGGGYTTGWADVAGDPLWDVDINPLRGSERLRAMQTTANATHVVRGRWRDDVGPESSLLHEDRRLLVVSPPVDPDELHEYLDVYVRETVA